MVHLHPPLADIAPRQHRRALGQLAVGGGLVGDLQPERAALQVERAAGAIGLDAFHAADRPAHKLEALEILRQRFGRRDAISLFRPEAAPVIAGFGFQRRESLAAASRVRIDPQARAAAAEHFSIQPEVRPEGIGRPHLGEGPVIPVAGQAAIEELDLPAEGHVLQHAPGLFLEGLSGALLIGPGRGFDTGEAHALAGVQHQRVAIDNADNAAMLARSDLLPPDIDPRPEATHVWTAAGRTEADEEGRAKSYLTAAQAVHVVAVEIDPETGEVEITKYAVVDDCGTRLNPVVVEGQLEGSVAQGIGAALYEQYLYDEDAQPLTTTFMDYLIPTVNEMPPLLKGEVVTPSPFTPLGAKGCGEGAIHTTPAAVMCAVNDALAPLGIRSREVPATSNRIWDLIREKQG